MLQRIQTIYLLAVFILTLLLFFGPLAFISQETGGIYLKTFGVEYANEESLNVATWPLILMVSISALLSFLTIFSYLNRPRQMRLIFFLMFFDLGIIGMVLYYIYYIMQKFEGLRFVFQWRVMLPLIIPILLILAFRGIRKDEILVKAADRLR